MLAPTSTLFGNINAKVARKPQTNDPNFRELVSRINRTLIIIPSAPQVQPIDGMDEPDTAGHDAAPSTTQVEIPYVPASQRGSARANVEDTIIVVGQARQKKRKRVKDTPNPLEPAASADGPQPQKEEKVALTEGDTETQNPFDFSSVPNILDNDSHITEVKKKRQKKQKNSKGGMFYGDFRAPPKAHSELKSGNQSHTFK
ncbi:hypothetical protein BD779DRAFT_721231 [Infundibulicybe gibba]|nr:hypothetical protein BD779DRAFT_721231 [Infundibulicybe gibba]